MTNKINLVNEDDNIDIYNSYIDEKVLESWLFFFSIYLRSPIVDQS